MAPVVEQHWASNLINRHLIGLATCTLLPKTLAVSLVAHVTLFTTDYLYIMYAEHTGTDDGTIKTDAGVDDNFPVCVRNANETAVCQQHWLHPACKPCRKVGSVGRDHWTMGVAVALSVVGLLMMFIVPILLRKAFRGVRPIIGAFLITLVFVIGGRAIAAWIISQRRHERPGLVPYWRWPGVESCMIAIVFSNICLCIAQIACYRRLRKEDATGRRGWALLGDMERGYANRPSDASMFSDFAMWSVILMAGASATLNGLKDEVTLYEDVLEGLGICSRLFTLYYVILLSGWAAGIGVNPVTNTANRSVEDYFADEDAKIRFLVLLTCVPPIKPIGTEFSCLSDLTQPQPLGRYKLQTPITWERLHTLLTEQSSRVRYCNDGAHEKVYVKKSVGKVQADGSVRVVERRNAAGEVTEQQQVVICYELERVSELEWHAVTVWKSALQAEINLREYNNAPSLSETFASAAGTNPVDKRVWEGHVITRRANQSQPCSEGRLSRRL